MTRKVSLSGAQLTVENIAMFYVAMRNALLLYYGKQNPNYLTIFAGRSAKEVQDECGSCLKELDLNAAFSVLACVEGMFKVDYLNRCYGKKKDELSRELRALYNKYEDDVSFDEDILRAWKQHVHGLGALISEIRGAFKFRHWLAHGRYWNPKLGMNYDYYSVSILAVEVKSVLQSAA